MLRIGLVRVSGGVAGGAVPAKAEPQGIMTTNKPKKSERPIGKWLSLIGSTDIEYWGDKSQGPPDFIAKYHGKRIAVEARLLPTKAKKVLTRNKEIERCVQRMVEELDAHRVCEVRFDYDPRLPKKSLKYGAWKDGVVEAVRSGASGEFQVLPDEKRKNTRGIEITISRAPNKVHVPVQESMGERIDEKAMTDSIQNVVDIVREKSVKVQRGGRASQYNTWWLVIDGDLLMERGHLLFPGEMEKISLVVRNLDESRQWSKIIVISRLTGNHFCPLWESDEQPRLPRPD